MGSGSGADSEGTGSGTRDNPVYVQIASKNDAVWTVLRWSVTLVMLYYVAQLLMSNEPKNDKGACK